MTLTLPPLLSIALLTAALTTNTGPALATSTKKKRLVKLSRKQLKRKQMKRERGENKELMRGNKAQRDFVRRERKDVARTSW